METEYHYDVRWTTIHAFHTESSIKELYDDYCRCRKMRGLEIKWDEQAHKMWRIRAMMKENNFRIKAPSKL
jgi:hypothetical protein